MPVTTEPSLRISLTDLARGTAWHEAIAASGSAAVMRHGRPFAYVLSPAEYGRYERLLREEEARQEEEDVRAIFAARSDDGPFVRGEEAREQAEALIDERLSRAASLAGA